MTITLTIAGRTFGGRLSTYDVSQEVTYQTLITTIDGTEHAAGQRKRTVITFSLLPYDEDTATDDYTALVSDQVLSVAYTDPFVESGSTKTENMRITSNLNSTFGIDSANGKRYYKGGSIVLRGTGVT